VINYDVPDTADAYNRRVGRMGRVDRTEEALTLEQSENDPVIRQIEKLLGKPFQRRRLAGFNDGGFNAESRPASGGGNGTRGSPKGNGRRQSRSSGRQRSR
jgi:ATP-dependent RNA helicase RhlE